MDKAELDSIFSKFDIAGQLVSIIPIKQGHINDTYLSEWKTEVSTRFIHQRINHNVFKDVPALMNNVARVLKHIEAKLGAQATPDSEDTVISVIPTKDGNLYHQDSKGDYWRTYSYVEGSQTFETCTGDSQAFEAGAACARFARHLADLNPSALSDSIPYFHHAPKRLEAFERALNADLVGRAASCKTETDFIEKRADDLYLITSALEGGTLPTRIAHNDCKLNNILFSRKSGRGIALVDLDTCMAGSWLYDFGDLVRTTAVKCVEDEQDLSRVVVSRLYYNAIERGYLSEVSELITPKERELLHFAPKIITLVLGIRFLTDYLEGDNYFKIHRTGHNLDRTRVQLKIVEGLERLSQ